MTYREAKEKILELDIPDEALNSMLMILKDFKRDFDNDENEFNYCAVCSGSGLGMSDGATCQLCKGKGDLS